MPQAPSALIGHTGFVGSSLRRILSFDYCYNSQNSQDMVGKQFGLVVCAGVSAEKWIANQNPESDRIRIQRLIETLSTITADTFVLISTVDVYDHPDGVVETDIPDSAKASSYGRNRRLLELWVEEQFKNYRIIRLPGLFGIGLKKNILYDLVNNNQVERINPQSVFQWYPTRRLAGDIQKCLLADVRVVNISTEPIQTAAILGTWFPSVLPLASGIVQVKYDMRTLHAALLGGQGHYHMQLDEVMAELGFFFKGQMV